MQKKRVAQRDSSPSSPIPSRRSISLSFLFCNKKARPHLLHFLFRIGEKKWEEKKKIEKKKHKDMSICRE